MKKLIPAIVMLLVSAVVLSTASYAWFTTSEAVTADGMSVTAEAPTSVLISGKGQDGNFTTPASSVDFTTLVTTANRLYPASSPDGEAFFAPDECENFAGSAKYGTTIKTAAEEVTGGAYYHDYIVKIQNTSTTHSVTLNVSELVADGGAIAGAIRVAVLVKQESGDYEATGIYNPNAEENEWVALLGADGTASGSYAEGPLKATGTFDAEAAGAKVNYSDATVGVVTLDPYAEDGSTDYVKEIAIRIWFEGQDADCVTSNANQSANIEIKFDILSSAEYVAP